MYIFQTVYKRKGGSQYFHHTLNKIEQLPQICFYFEQWKWLELQTSMKITWDTLTNHPQTNNWFNI